MPLEKTACCRDASVPKLRSCLYDVLIVSAEVDRLETLALPDALSADIMARLHVLLPALAFVLALAYVMQCSGEVTWVVFGCSESKPALRCAAYVSAAERNISEPSLVRILPQLSCIATVLSSMLPRTTFQCQGHAHV